MRADGMITVDEALEIMENRGVLLDRAWLRKKARDGKIAGAQKIGGIRGVWLVPREWAENYERGAGGRPRR